jgi:hypothetical protein
VYVPKGVRLALYALPGGRHVHSFLLRSFDYVVNKPNPLLQLFFLTLVLGGFSVFVFYGFPLIPNKRLSELHLLLPFNMLFFVLSSFTIASSKPAGRVTRGNCEKLIELYPHDGFMFPRGKECSTCKLPKVARSKHCRMQNACVPAFDHFCPCLCCVSLSP